MKRSQAIFCALLLVTLTGCKTQEDIRRERTVETINEELQQTKKTAASGNSRLMAIEEQLARLTGLVEEANHARSQAVKENQNLNERINVLEESNKKQTEYLKALTEKVNNQSGYIEEVIESLAKLSDKPKKKVINPDSVELELEESLPATYENGLKKYRAKDYEGAKEILLKVSEEKKTSKKNREGATHYLGMIEYRKKNYEGAKIYFSKLFSSNPDSSFAPPALLNLGKTFKELKSIEEADLTFEELISRFPKSKEAQEAKKLKTKT